MPLAFLPHSDVATLKDKVMPGNLDTTKLLPLRWQDLILDEMGSKVYACECCGSTTRRIWGGVNDQTATIAAYYVNWVFGRRDHGVQFDVVVGRWGEAASAADRGNVRLDYRSDIDAPSFMVADAECNSLANHAFARSEVVVPNSRTTPSRLWMPC